MCYTDGNCGFYATTNEEYEDRMNQDYIDEERLEFYNEWFEYIDQYE